jgi:SdpI/YfhL protein family
MLVPAIAEVIAGLIVIWLAIQMRQGRVARGSALGVRTPSTMRSDAAFETANKAAAPLAGAGGAILAVCGILAAVLPRHLAGGLHLRRRGILSCLLCPRCGDWRSGLPIRAVSVLTREGP